MRALLVPEGRGSNRKTWLLSYKKRVFFLFFSFIFIIKIIIKLYFRASLSRSGCRFGHCLYQKGEALVEKHGCDPVIRVFFLFLL